MSHGMDEKALRGTAKRRKPACQARGKGVNQEMTKHTENLRHLGMKRKNQGVAGSIKRGKGSVEKDMANPFEKGPPCPRKKKKTHRGRSACEKCGLGLNNARGKGKVGKVKVNPYPARESESQISRQRSRVREGLLLAASEGRYIGRRGAYRAWTRRGEKDRKTQAKEGMAEPLLDPGRGWASRYLCMKGSGESQVGFKRVITTYQHRRLRGGFTLWE